MYENIHGHVPFQGTYDDYNTLDGNGLLSNLRNRAVVTFLYSLYNSFYVENLRRRSDIFTLLDEDSYDNYIITLKRYLYFVRYFVFNAYSDSFFAISIEEQYNG